MILHDHIPITALLALLPACAIERLEAIFDEHGQTYVTTDVGGSETTSSETTGTSDASASDTSTGAAESTDGAEAGQDASSEPDPSTTSTAGTSTTGDGTTGPEAVCGNGVLEEFGLTPEECDDGNLVAGDGCSDTCAADLRMFVTSYLYKAGDFESLYLADALCAQAANDVDMPNWLKFRAWLSDSKTHARDRFKYSRGRIVLVNGLVVADSWSELLAGKLQNPVEVTQLGETYHGGVWTGTDPQGVGVAGATHCDDWTSLSFKKAAHYGYSDRATPEWTLSASDNNPSPCPSSFALYCIEER